MEAEKLTRKERERLSHRSQILADALELFKEKGYHSVSMHEIAAKAEFSIGTLYKFFKNKEDLYGALVIEKASEFYRAVAEVLSKKEDIESVLKDYIDFKISAFRENLSLVRLLFLETKKGLSFDKEAGCVRVMHELHQEEIAQVASLLEKGIRLKMFKKLDPHRLAVALGGLIDGFMLNWLEDPDKHPYAGNTSFVAELFFNGCLAVKKPIHLVD